MDDAELVRNIKYISKKLKVRLEGVCQVDSIPYSPSGKVRNDELKQKPQHGAIIMALMPLISAVMMWTLKKARPSNFTIVSIVLALFGVVLVITKGELSALSGGSLFPSLVILAGAFCWVTYTLGASYVSGYSVLRYTALSCFFGALTIV
ncbi:DMT family transporter, partial [Vibrio vulnificus]|uniref:DMT family transporter n=1 Tax=Vibrio vulnificus TaxID=672 RepID=UPI000A65B8E2